jgi:hypothetical protein
MRIRKVGEFLQAELSRKTAIAELSAGRMRVLLGATLNPGGKTLTSGPAAYASKTLIAGPSAEK